MIIRRRSTICSLALLLAIVAGCAAPRGVADLSILDQNPAAYHAKGPARPWRVNPSFQRRLAAEFLAKYFEVWRPGSQALDPGEVLAMAHKVIEAPGIGPAGRPHDRAWLERLTVEAGLDVYPNAGWPGLTAGRCHLRLLPSDEADYEGRGPGQGYPFDRLQQTSLPPNLPLRVHHVSASGDWLLVASAWAWGWLPASAVIRLSPAEVERWREGRFLAVLRDDTPLLGPDDTVVLNAPQGSLFPLLGRGGPGWRALAAARQADGSARLVEARVDKPSAAPFPLPLNSADVARLANGLAGQAYGWGGIGGPRDCSATTKDLMAPFGLWLDRNSADQARRGGQFIDLGGMGAAEKERFILRRGAPLLTLLWMPGHVMLYIGQHQGRAVVFQNLWGLRINQGFCGTEGRLEVRRAVVTTLTPGAERWDLARPEGLLINRIEGMVLLVPEREIIRQ